jgi:hypothetical protein
MSKDRITFVGVLTDNQFKQKPFKASDFNAIQEYIKQNQSKDTYTTYNEFKEPTTNTLDNIAIVKKIVIDLDNHLSGGFNLQEAKALVELIKQHFNAEIPNPKAINYSGRGIHFYIEIEPDQDIHKYNAVAKGILHSLDKLVGEYNALINTRLSVDHGAIGAWRYIRAEGTYNTKAHAYCTGIYHSNAVYTLDTLITDFVPILEPVIRGELSAEEYITNTTWRAFKPYRKGYTEMSWRMGAIDDLKTIQRNRESDIRRYKGSYRIGNEGFRNNMLFMFGVLCKWAFNDRAQVLDSMRAFNTYYAHGVLTDKEVEQTYRNVLKERYKPYSAKKIISVLEITPDEMSDLKVLIDRTEVKRRTYTRVKQYKQNKASIKQLEKLELINTVNELHATGASLRAIAKELKLSINTVKKYLKSVA